MLTDDEGLRLFEKMRRATKSAGLALLCDWVISLARRQAVASVRRANRNKYMAALMRRRRRERAAQKRQRA